MKDYKKIIFNLSTQKCESVDSFESFFLYFERVLAEFKNSKSLPQEFLIDLEAQYFDKLELWFSKFYLPLNKLVIITEQSIGFYKFLKNVQYSSAHTFIDNLLSLRVFLMGLNKRPEGNLYLECSVAQALCFTNYIDGLIPNSSELSKNMSVHDSLKKNVFIFKNGVKNNLSFENLFLMHVDKSYPEIFPYISKNKDNILSYLLNNTSSLSQTDKVKTLINLITKHDALSQSNLHILDQFLKTKTYELRNQVDDYSWSTNELKQLREYHTLMVEKFRLEQTVISNQKQIATIYKI